MSGYTKVNLFVISNDKAFTGPFWSSKTKHLSINNRAPKKSAHFPLSGSESFTTDKFWFQGYPIFPSLWGVLGCHHWFSTSLSLPYTGTLECLSWIQKKGDQPLRTWGLTLAIEKCSSSFVWCDLRMGQSWWPWFGPYLGRSSRRMLKPEIYGLLVLDPCNIFSLLEDERVTISYTSLLPAFCNM